MLLFSTLLRTPVQQVRTAYATLEELNLVRRMASGCVELDSTAAERLRSAQQTVSSAIKSETPRSRITAARQRWAHHQQSLLIDLCARAGYSLATILGATVVLAGDATWTSGVATGGKPTVAHGGQSRRLLEVLARRWLVVLIPEYGTSTCCPKWYG